MTLGLIPTIFFKQFGNGHSDLKWPIYFVLGAIVLIDFALRPARPRLFRWQGWYLAFFGFQLLSIFSAANAGLWLWAAAGTLTCGLLSVWVGDAELDPRTPAVVLAIAAVVVATVALAMVLFRADVGSGRFGSTLGMKNSVSVWLAQVLPLLLPLPERSRRRAYLTHLAVVVVGGLAVWVILAYRTRSAWWMLAVEGAILLILHLRRRDAAGRMLERFATCLVLGGALLVVVPNRLEWNSRTPYSDSLTTMASLERSSGRKELWRVGLTMVRARPFLGTGAGNYPAEMRLHVPRSGIEPKTLAFLQPDLPLFNDYLQATVEVGLVGGLAFAILALGLPLVALRRSWRAAGDEWTFGAVASCVAVAFDALVDYPFNRPENLVVHTGALAFALRAVTAPSVRTKLATNAPGRFARLAQWTGVTVLLTISTCSCTSFELRRRAIHARRDAVHLDLAYRLWPWDARWSSKHARWHTRERRTADAMAYARRRLGLWPGDPESYLSLAIAANAAGDIEAARAAYARAIEEVPGGRCYPAGHEAYLAAVEGARGAELALPNAPAREDCR